MEKTEVTTEVVVDQKEEVIVDQKEVVADQKEVAVDHADIEETGSIDEAEFKIIEKRLVRKIDLR
jgi:hypothetical protein